MTNSSLQYVNPINYIVSSSVGASGGMDKPHPSHPFIEPHPTVYATPKKKSYG